MTKHFTPLLLLCLLSSITLCTAAESYSNITPKEYSSQDDNSSSHAVFPGGSEALIKFIQDNLKYPAEAEAKGVSGRVLVQFIVDKEGAIHDAKVLRPVNPSLDAEALRVINLMPNWIPATQNGEKVDSRYTIPLTFRLRPTRATHKTTLNDSISGTPADTTLVDKSDINSQNKGEHNPEFPGGNAALMQFLINNVQYPAEAQDNKVGGRIIVQFVVDKEGNITDPKVIKAEYVGLTPKIIKKALRKLLMPRPCVLSNLCPNGYRERKMANA